MLEKMGGWLWICLNHLKQLGALIISISTFLVFMWGLFSVDVSELDGKVTAVVVGDKVFVELITYKIPATSATIYYRLDNEEVLHHHYEALPDGKHIQVLPLPVEVKSEVRVDLEIQLEGVRTLFTDNDVKFTEYVVTGE